MHLPAHRDALGVDARHARRRSGGSPRTRSGIVVREDAEVERLVGALAHAALARRERARWRSGSLTGACSRASWQRGLELVVAPRHDAVELPPQRLLERAAHGRPLGHAGGQQVVARDLEPDARGDRSTQRSTGSDGAPQRQRERERLERLAGRAARAARTACARARGAPGDARRHARGARRRVALARPAGSGPRATGRAPRARSRRAPRAPSAARSAPIAAAPSAADATSSGSGSSSGWSALWISSSRMQLDGAPRLLLRRTRSISSSPIRAPDTVDSASAATASRARRSVSGSSANRAASRSGPRAAGAWGRHEAVVVEHADRAGLQVPEPAVRVVADGRGRRRSGRPPSR